MKVFDMSPGENGVALLKIQKTEEKQILDGKLRSAALDMPDLRSLFGRGVRLMSLESERHVLSWRYELECDHPTYSI